MSGRVKFLADANFDHTIIDAVIRIQPTIEFHASGDEHIDLRGLPDPDVLALASQMGCILLTHDVRTMPQHFGEFLANGNNSSGVILVPQLTPINLIIDDLLLIWEGSTPTEWIDHIDRIPWK